MKDGFNKTVNMTFLYDVLCFKSYSEDGNEYWSEGNVYKASRNGDYWYIKTNFGGIGVVGDGYAIEDLDDYFIYLS